MMALAVSWMAAIGPQACRIALRRLVSTAGLLVLPALLACPARLSAQPTASAGAATNMSDWIATRWGSDEGLPQNTVQSLAQTLDGRLWVGTLGGLVRFDGLSFSRASAPTRARLSTLSLVTDDRGALWAVTTGGFARLWGGEARFFDLSAIAPDRPIAVVKGLGGALWLATERGALVEFRDERLVVRLPGGSTPTPDPSPVAVDRSGAVWMGTPTGLVRYTASATRHYNGRDGLPDDAVRVLLAEADGSVLVATTRGLVRVHDGRITTVHAQLFAALGRQPTGLLRDQTGSLWIATDRGLFQLQGQVARRVPDIPEQPVHTIFRDAEDILWIGVGSDGLMRLRRPRIRHFAESAGLSDKVWGVAGDASGRIFVADGPRLLLRQGDRFVPWLGPDTGLPDDEITAIRPSAGGGIWLGWQSGGVAYVDGQRLTRRFAAGERGLPAARVNALYEDASGRLLVGTTRGAVRIDRDQVTRIDGADGLDGQWVTVFHEDRQRTLWIGVTDRGVLSLAGRRATWYGREQGMRFTTVTAIHEDDDGTIWIGNSENGLTRLKAGRLSTVAASDGLADDATLQLFGDAHRRLWMCGDRGIFSAPRDQVNAVADGDAQATVRSTHYGRSDGVLVSECYGGLQSSGWQAPDGTIWLVTLRGVATVDTSLLNPRPPRVAIEGVTIDASPYATAASVEAPVGEGRLSISYTASNLGTPEKTTFEVRLEGFDRDWSAVGTRRTVFYTNLPPGEYRFHVRARNDDGVLSEPTAPLAIRLRPRFTQTRLFHGLLALGAGALLFGAFQWRARRLARIARELEARVRERTAEVERQRVDLEQTNAALASVNRDLENSRDSLQHARDSLVIVLNQLQLGVLILDPDGRVRYASGVAIRLLHASPSAIVGQPWTTVLSLTEADRARVQHRLTHGADAAGRIPVRLDVGERQYWMEIDAEPEPPPGDGRLLYLYDVTETYNLRALVEDAPRFTELIGQSPAMEAVYQRIRDVAASDVTVLVEGETGTGKELVARAIHRESPRRNKPFIAVNTAGLTETLLASQLFGHKRGAFTSAVSDSVGLFEAADGGTIFLDEVGDIPSSVQVQLLRVLQEREVLRLGDTKPRKINVRIVTATHRNLTELVASGQFREDLLYRIRVVPIVLPPLRARVNDVPLLVRYLLPEVNRMTGRSVREVSYDAMVLLGAYSWPGNVRELKSALAQAVLHSSTELLQVEDLPFEIQGTHAPRRQPEPDSAQAELLEALRAADGNRAEAARRLGVSRSTLYRRLAAFGLPTRDD